MANKRPARNSRSHGDYDHDGQQRAGLRCGERRRGRKLHPTWLGHSPFIAKFQVPQETPPCSSRWWFFPENHSFGRSFLNLRGISSFSGVSLLWSVEGFAKYFNDPQKDSELPMITLIINENHCAIGCINIPHYHNWLVVWNINFIFPYIGLLIIPIDVHIFQRGGPTTNQINMVVDPSKSEFVC